MLIYKATLRYSKTPFFLILSILSVFLDPDSVGINPIKFLIPLIT